MKTALLVVALIVCSGPDPVTVAALTALHLESGWRNGWHSP